MQNPQTKLNFPPSNDSEVPLGKVVELITTDPAEFEFALRPWELWVKPKEAGAFHNKLLMLAAPEFMIYREWYQLSLHIQGLSPANMLGIGIPMGSVGQAGLYWGISHPPGRTLPASLPGPVDGKLFGGHSQIIIFIHLDLLKRELSDSLYKKLKLAADTHLVSANQRYLYIFSVWANTLLKNIRLTPNLVKSATIIEVIKQELIDHLINLASSIPPETVLIPSSARTRGFKKAIEYLRYTQDKNVPISKLCHVSGISERSLQYAFQDAFGMPPNIIMQYRRLHFVRQELLLSDTKSVSVTEVAMKFGFLELGRFANRYKKLFGELPSQTLARKI